MAALSFSLPIRYKDPMNNVVEYSFSKANKKTVVFIPGYSGGLEVSTIKELVSYFVKQNTYNVFGINLDYVNDIQDEFKASQESLIASVRKIASKASDSEVILLAKSLGGSLTLFNYQELPVSKIVVLGCSVVLGWPQRISLLQSKNPEIPDYKSEWNKVLNKINVPTLILSGDSDDLTDNEYLSQVAIANKYLQLAIINQANHNLEHTETKKLQLEVLLQRINLT